MNCDEARRLLDLDADGELDVVRHVELAEHIKTCPDCAARVEAIQARKTALRTKLSRHHAPSDLAAKLRSSIAESSTNTPTSPTNAVVAPFTGTPTSTNTKSDGPGVIFYLRQVAGLAALVAVSLVLGYNFGNRHGQRDRLIAEAVDSHVRSLEAGPLMEVISTDQHTVKPWFAGKLDFSPPVFDLVNEGFPLVGGRRDRLAGQTVAALVFHRHQHTINLYIWPASTSPTPTRESEENGYHTEQWTAKGFTFLAISDVGAADLAEFARDYRVSDAPLEHSK
jgi:anti-sigma factor RsiW